MPPLPLSTSTYGSDRNEVIIIVMGATGSGKTRFVNLASGSELTIGDGLRSCTSTVQIGGPFKLCRRSVTLVDTPGFDDTTIPDIDILKMIALYLSTLYELGCKISGVIYMHRICDLRVGGIARRNFSMFRNLCGDENLENVIIVTNMWGEVDLSRGQAHERELLTDPELFQPVMLQGAQMLRHDNTVESARAIVARCINFHPVALRIQRELVDEGKDISETSAGQELDRELVALMAKHRTEMADLQREMAISLAARDVQAQRELDGERWKLQGTIEQLEHDRERISGEFQDEKRHTEQNLQIVKKQLEDERRARESRQREIERLQLGLQNLRDTSVMERESMLRQIRELEIQQDQCGSREVVRLLITVVTVVASVIFPVLPLPF